jgi:hypothetical protein
MCVQGKVDKKLLSEFEWKTVEDTRVILSIPAFTQSPRLAFFFFNFLLEMLACSGV